MNDVPPPPPTAAWQVSSFSSSGNCVEVASADDFVWVRDTKDRRRPAHGFHRSEWAAFVAGVKAGEFD